MINMWKAEISRTILNIFRSYNGMHVLKFLFLQELYEKTFVVPYVVFFLIFIILSQNTLNLSKKFSLSHKIGTFSHKNDIIRFVM